MKIVLTSFCRLCSINVPMEWRSDTLVISVRGNELSRNMYVTLFVIHGVTKYSHGIYTMLYIFLRTCMYVV